jgi:hypothetical protein
MLADEAAAAIPDQSSEPLGLHQALCIEPAMVPKFATLPALNHFHRYSKVLEARTGRKKREPSMSFLACLIGDEYHVGA